MGAEPGFPGFGVGMVFVMRSFREGDDEPVMGF